MLLSRCCGHKLTQEVEMDCFNIMKIEEVRVSKADIQLAAMGKGFLPLLPVMMRVLVSLASKASPPIHACKFRF